MKPNKLYILLSVILMVAGLNSCSDDFLNLKPLVNKLDENSYRTEDDALNAMASVYKALTANNGLENVPTNSDIYSDDCYAAGEPGGGMPESWQPIELGISEPTTESSLLWQKFWRGVYRANTYLQKEADIDWKDPAKRQRMKGEVLTLRAYFYWDLVRLFGWVTIFPEIPPDVKQVSTVTQNTPDEVYKFIAQDLLTALPLLPDKVNSPDEAGHITRDVARVLICRIYMYYQNFVKPIIGPNSPVAAEWTDGNTVIDKAYVQNLMEVIIASNRYHLLPNYADVFSWANQNNEESIFEWQYSEYQHTAGFGTMNQGGNFSCHIYGIRNPNGDPNISGGWSFATLSFTLYNEFEPGDTRKNVTIYNAQDSLISYTRGFQNTGYFNYKYMPQAAYTPSSEPTQNWPDNYRDMRYSEVLLNAAELFMQANPGKALGYLNQVRERAGLPDRTSIDAYTLLHERRVEFACEGHRKWYLMEYDALSGNSGKLDSVTKYIDASFVTTSMPSYVVKDDFVGRHFNIDTWGMLPIPQNEIDLNPAIKQFVPAFK